MLHLLVEYANAKRLNVEPGFKPKTIKWGVRFTTEGKLSAIVPLGNHEEKGWKGMEFPVCPDLSQPELVGGTEVRCHFLVESAAACCLYHEKGSAELTERDHGKHRFFINLLEAASVDVPALAAVAKGLACTVATAEIQDRLRELKAKSKDLVTVGLEGFDGTWVVSDSSWHPWWRRFRDELKNSTGHAVRMRCLISGELVEPAATHPKIEDLDDVGGQGSGSSLVSFDKEAFCSFQLDQSRNAAASPEMAAAYRGALNSLIRVNGTRLAGAKVVHWYAGEQPDDDPIDWLNFDDTPKETKEVDARAKARELLASIRTGKRPDLAQCRYHALILSGAAGRVMVRDWMEGQFEDLVRCIDEWFNHLQMVELNNQLARPPRFTSVLGALVRRENGNARLEDVPAPLEARMWCAAVQGAAIPDAAQAITLAKYRGELLADPDRIGNPVCMGLLRAHLVRKGDTHMQPQLNPEHPDPAYHCGRVLAILAKLQEAALGKVGAGVIQRYYPAASSTPALVFGRLLRTAQFHTDKLDKGLAYWFQQQIADAMRCLGDSIPSTLTLQQQSLFALGFYQQFAEMSTKKTQPSTETT
jgi:CRISPR-associated protein Csd1